MVSVSGATRSHPSRVHLAVAVTDRPRRSLARPDHQIIVTVKNKASANRSAQAWQRRLHGLGRWTPLGQIAVNEVSDEPGVGFGGETAPSFLKDWRSSRKFSMMPLWTTRRAWWRGDGRLFSVSACRASPSACARCRDGRGAATTATGLRDSQLAFGAPAIECAILQRRDAAESYRDIPALERIDQLLGNRATSQNPQRMPHIRVHLSCKVRREPATGALNEKTLAPGTQNLLPIATPLRARHTSPPRAAIMLAFAAALTARNFSAQPSAFDLSAASDRQRVIGDIPW